MRDMVQVRRTGGRPYQAPEARIGRSQFNRSHGRKMTFNASYLYPIFVDEVLPGDTFTMSLNGFARVFSPLDSPIMDNIELETFFFFVPNRLVWDNWEYFMGAHDAAGAQDTTYTIPAIGSGLTVNHDDKVTAAGLAACFGLPEGLSTAAMTINALPFRAYNLIYNEWFRDQNLIDEITVDTDNGTDTVSNYAIRKSAKKHDYFTSCLPYLQKGTAQTVAITGIIPVIHDGSNGDPIAVYSTGASELRDLNASAADLTLDSTTASDDEEIYVNLSFAPQTGGSVATLDVNSLRYSVAVQRLLERDARGGTRYVESIKAQFGVTSPDFRLQRPEYLGGGRSMLNVAPVAVTSPIDSTAHPATEDEYTGQLRGVGTGVIRGHSWAKSFTEHGHVIGLIRARGDITYFQGVEKLWRRSARLDFYFPALAHLGEQSVLNSEIYYSGDSNDDLVFGYQERWAEYRMKHSQLVNNFNPDVTGALSHWHLAEDFSSLPSLNQTFVEDATPMDRVVSVTTEPDFMLDLWFNYRCARPMPVRSIPGITTPRF